MYVFVRAAAIQELDTLADELNIPNLDGFLVRCEESKRYREPPRGVGGVRTPPDPPSDLEVQANLNAARVEARRRNR